MTIEEVEKKIEELKKEEYEAYEAYKAKGEERGELVVLLENMKKKQAYSNFVGSLLAYGLGVWCRELIGNCIEYEKMTEEEKKEHDKKRAKRMFDRAMAGKLTSPYDEDEIAFIRENLEL